MNTSRRELNHTFLRGWRSVASYCRREFSNETQYYDSQSGLHLPKHNETEISIFLDISKQNLGKNSFLPTQLYKEDSSDVPGKLEAMRKEGVAGICLPPITFPRDIRNLQTLHHVAPDGFRFIASMDAMPPADIASSLSIMLEFPDEVGMQSAQEALTTKVQNSFHTTLRLGEAVCDGGNAMSVASRLATMIDNGGGVDWIWITPNSEICDEDDMAELCEELMYLDVAGPTIKSRIIVDSVKEEIIDEMMLMGINKFALKEDFQIDVVEEIAKAQGKRMGEV